MRRMCMAHSFPSCIAIFSASVGDRLPARSDMAPAKQFSCPDCGSVFARAANRNRHRLKLHGGAAVVYDCPLCGHVYDNVRDLRLHIAAHAPDTEYKIVNNRYDDALTVYRKRYLPPQPSLEHTLGQDFDQLERILSSEAARKRFAKGQIISTVEFVKTDHQTGAVARRATMHFRSRVFVLTVYQNYISHVNEAFAKVRGNIDDFVRKGSGWTLEAVYATDLEVNRCRPLAGGCGGTVALELSIAAQRRLVQPHADDDHMCFFYAVAYHFLPTEDKARLADYVSKHFRREGIALPVRIQDVAKFERMNSHLRLKINVLYREEQDVYPVYVSREESWRNNINILLYKTELDSAAISHYFNVPSLEKLMRRTYIYRNPSTGKETRSYRKLKVCPNCLCQVSGTDVLIKHFHTCRRNRAQAVRMPKTGEVIEFKNFMKKFKVPLVGFYDFESVMVKPLAPCSRCPNTFMCYHKATVEAVQQAGTYSVLIVDHLGNIVHQKTHSSEDCADQFVEDLLELEPELLELLNEKRPMSLTQRQELQFRAAQQCHICEEFFLEDSVRVRDHCHLTGQFMGAAHQSCNLKRTVVKKIPLFCHNFTGYDGHLVVKGIKKDPRVHTMQALARNTERFRTLQINSYHFLDSMSFLDGSLGDVVDDLRKSGHPFQLLDLTDLCSGRRAGHKGLLLQKGVYPYEFAQSVEQLRAATRLPPIEKFFSKVANTGVSPEDYRHAQEVYRKFSCENMLDYCELYCQLDVVLLAECLLSFRAEVEREFGLDCCHYISLPQLAFDGMLKMTQISIECLTDVDMLLFLEQNIRGGVSFINQRRCQDTRARLLEEGRSDEEILEAASSWDAEKMLYIDGE
jgi:DNA polymerase type B, organellar and viral